MTLKTKATTLFAKPETVYGTAVVLAAADAIRTHGLKYSFVSQSIERDLDSAGQGNTGKIHAGTHMMVEFDVEESPSGVAGTAPKYGHLIKACRCSEVVVALTSVTYAPAVASTDSETMYFQLDGQRHALKGARGSMQKKYTSQGIPYRHFKFIGLWVDPVSTADIVPNFTGFTKPRPIAFDYTPKVTLHALQSVYKDFSFDDGNQVEYLDNPGEQSVEIVDRKAVGSISLLAPTIATKDYFSTTKNDTDGNLIVTHGMTAGAITTFTAGVVQLDDPQYGDDKGRATVQAKLDIKITGVDDDWSEAYT